MVPSPSCRHLPTEQQVRAGDVYRPDRNTDQFLQEKGAIHQQEQGQAGVLAQLGHAE